MADVMATATDIQMDYMKLLITQLQNQNPLEPLDNNQMASQLAQFSQLQQLETMNSKFANVLENVERSYAVSLIGKNVSFVGQTDFGSAEILSGTVLSVANNIHGQIMLDVEGRSISLEDILLIGN